MAVLFWSKKILFGGVSRVEAYDLAAILMIYLFMVQPPSVLQKR